MLASALQEAGRVRSVASCFGNNQAQTFAQISSLVCADSTHKTNEYGDKLITLMVIGMVMFNLVTVPITVRSVEFFMQGNQCMWSLFGINLFTKNKELPTIQSFTIHLMGLMGYLGSWDLKVTAPEKSLLSHSPKTMGKLPCNHYLTQLGCCLREHRSLNPDFRRFLLYTENGSKNHSEGFGQLATPNK